MPMYSQEIIEEVRSRSDIVSVISGRISLSKKGSNYFGCCPFHNEKTASFSVSRDRQMYHCFGCGVSGNVYTFLMEYENMSFVEAVKELAAQAGVALPEREMTKEERLAQDKKSRLFEIQKDAASYFYALLRSERGRLGMDYFKGRGLTDEIMKKFGLGFADKYYDDLYNYLHQKGYPDDLLKNSGLVGFDGKHGMHDKFFNRVMFPIFNERGRVVAFGGRVMGDGEPKYLNSNETDIFEKSRNLYGLNYARTSKRGSLILCEGYMDVIALHQAGFDNAVAALGTAFNERHANVIKKYASKVYLSFDSDGAGQKAALRAIPVLKSVGIPTKIIKMSPYKDPDEFIKNLGDEEYQKRIDEAEDSFLFEIEVMRNDFDMRDPQSKSEFQKEVAKKLMDFPIELERENYLSSVAEKFFINSDQLRELVRQLAAKGYVKSTPVVRPTSVKKTDTESGALKSQGLLLTWLIDNPSLYDTVRDQISPDDFTDPTYSLIAKELFAQIEEGKLNPAGIISLFGEDEEGQKKAAAAFHKTLPFEQDENGKSKALDDVIRNIKKESSIARLTSNASEEGAGLNALQDFLSEQAKMKKGDHK